MKSIQNILNGYHLNSKYWQDWKNQQPELDSQKFQIALGMVLSDAAMYRVSKEAYIKFEQGAKQKEFIQHLYDQFRGYTFMQSLGVRYSNSTIKSYWFKTFSHSTFTKVYTLFYCNGKKCISSNLISDHLEDLGFAYWIMGDGSLHREGRVLTLHTQGFTLEENDMLSKQLNRKFGLNSTVKVHKTKYFVVQFPAKDANRLHVILSKYVIDSIKYKLPRVEDTY